MASQAGQRTSKSKGEDEEAQRSSASRIPHLLSSPGADAATVDSAALLQFIRNKHSGTAQPTQHKAEEEGQRRKEQKTDEQRKEEQQKEGQGEEVKEEPELQQHLRSPQQASVPPSTYASHPQPQLRSQHDNHHHQHKHQKRLGDDEERQHSSLGGRLSAEMEEWRQGIRAQVFHKHMVLQRFWQRWQEQRPQRRRQLANLALANSFRDALLMKRAFELWRRMQALLHQRQTDGQAADAFRRSMLMHGALRLWQRRLHLVRELRRLETQSHPYMQRVRLWLALRRWQHLSRKKRDLEQRERVLHARALYFSAQQRLRQWRHRIATVWEAYRRLVQYQEEEKTARQHRYLRHWRHRLAIRRWVAQQSAVADAVAAGRRKRRALAQWRQAYRRMHRLRQIEAACRHEVRGPRLLCFTLTQMRVRAETKRMVRQQREAAVGHYRRNLLTTAVAAWRLALDRREAFALQPLMLKAIRHRQRALTSSTWLKWVRALGLVRRIAPLTAIAQHHRRQRVLPRHFRYWLQRAREQQRVRALQEAGSSFRCTHLARTALVHWHIVATGRAKQRRLLPDADALHAGTTRVRVLRAWRQRLQLRRVAAAQIDVATAQHAGFRQRLAWTRWAGLLVKRRQLRDVEATACTAHDLHVTAVMLRVWRSAYECRRDVAERGRLLSARKQQTSIAHTWTLWRTELAVKRANRQAVVLADRQWRVHAQRRCLKFWRLQYRGRQRAVDHHHTRVLRAAFVRMQAQSQRQQRRSLSLRRILHHARAVRARSTKVHAWRVWRGALVSRRRQREQWQQAATHHRTQMLRQGLLQLSAYARHRQRKRALYRRCEQWAVYRQKRAAFRRLRDVWLQQQHIHYMERLSLSMWAWHLRRKYFLRFVQRYRAHHELSAKRQRVLLWRSRKLKRMGLQRIIRVADDAWVASAATSAREGGEQLLRRLRLARWAAYRWRAFVCRRRQQRRQSMQQKPLWASDGAFVQLPRRRLPEIACDVGGGGGSLGDGDAGAKAGEEEPEELSSALRRARTRTKRVHHTSAFKGGAPPLWPGVLAPVPCGVGDALWPHPSSQWGGVGGDSYEGQRCPQQGAENEGHVVLTHSSGEDGEYRGEQQLQVDEHVGHEGLLVKMKQVLQHGVDLRLEIASLEDLQRSWDDAADTDMDQGEVEALLERKRARLRSVLTLCRKWQCQQQQWQ